jgi:predicted amidophosphoribosyltransferase
MINQVLTGIQKWSQDSCDVIFSRCCVACDRVGTLLCANCRELIPSLAQQREAHNELWFGAPYESVIREMINAHKDHGVRALSRELGLVLARAVWSAAVSSSTVRPLLLVPVPPHRTSLRRRGRDTAFEIAVQAANIVSDRGMPCEVTSVLMRVHETTRNAGKTVKDRREVRGSFAVKPKVRQLTRVMVVDDIVTTGATTQEAVRALEAAGIGVDAIACIASTALGR